MSQLKGTFLVLDIKFIEIVYFNLSLMALE